MILKPFFTHTTACGMILLRRQNSDTDFRKAQYLFVVSAIYYHSIIAGAIIEKSSQLAAGSYFVAG